ncbi:MAG: C40 family peptidase [Alphaproteobacteria bacterium]|jgi:cell wall-associated NlpC family hydrolase|nr:C40 family peptidase [Alphaproteobacteria bacterium]
MLNEELKAKIIEHAKNVYPSECCGLIVENAGVFKYYACRNNADNDHQFILDPKDYLMASCMGNIKAVVHSHPNASPKPSQADMVACEKTKLPWYIVGYPNQAWYTLEPTGYRAPLVGREWTHGVLDCYSIIRDWYIQERGIELPDFERQDEWWKKGEDLYRQNFGLAGFYKMESERLQVGDVILMQVKSNVPNHGAIYLGNDQILHHLFNRLSTREVYGGYYKKHTTDILRFGGIDEKDNTVTR